MNQIDDDDDHDDSVRISKVTNPIWLFDMNVDAFM